MLMGLETDIDWHGWFYIEQVSESHIPTIDLDLAPQREFRCGPGSRSMSEASVRGLAHAAVEYSKFTKIYQNIRNI